jgi:hypothetical protein
MTSRKSMRPSPATVLALLALVVASCGTAIAAGPGASTADKGSVSAQIGKRFPAYALVKDNADVVGPKSLRITNANVNQGLAPPYFCFRGLKFKFKGVQVTPSGNPMVGGDWSAVAATRDEHELFECSGQAQVEVVTSLNDSLEPMSFFIQFYK